MDLNILRSVATITTFVTFIGIVVWAMRRARQPDFDAAAQLPFVDDAPGSTNRGENQ